MIKAGDILTVKNDRIGHDGIIIFKAGQQVVVHSVETKKGHYSKLCPHIWIPECVTDISFVDIYGYYLPDSFYENEIGEKVAKSNLKKGMEIFNKKKFKSGNYVNTIKGVIIHPKLNIPAYTFEEDDSYVECRRCKILNKTEIKQLLK